MSSHAHLTDFHDLVSQEHWAELRRDDSGALSTVEVHSEIWDAAFAAAFRTSRHVLVDAAGHPYSISRPICLPSGAHLEIEPGVEIRLKPGSNTCMVRNETIRAYPDGPVPADTPHDDHITVEGGIWTTLFCCAGEDNGNRRGAADPKDSVMGAHGVFLFHGVEHLAIRRVTVRRSRPFAVHLGNITHFVVDGVRLDEHGRDGIHVDGPAHDGFIHDISGDSHDDTVALNAWDWRDYSVSFGPITDVRVEKVVGDPRSRPPVHDAIRLLAGKKSFADGTVLDCPIERITLSHIKNIEEFKLYDQPNLELGRDGDRSAGLGHLRDIHFRNLDFQRLGRIAIHADAERVTIDGVTISHPLPEGEALVEVGPKSQLYKPSADPATWAEIFSPELDCAVRGLEVSGVTINGKAADDRILYREIGGDGAVPGRGRVI